MAKKQPDKPANPARKTINIAVSDPSDTKAVRQQIARLVTGPQLAAARAVIATEGTTGIGAELEMTAMGEALKEQAAAINGGDLRPIEAMLINQATALQNLFARLVERGMNTNVVQQFDVHLRLALRAQAQCTRTLETLATMKNPPVVIARQANIAQQQQVNNGPAAPEPTRARAGPDSPKSKLLECVPSERLDSGTQGAASGAYSDLETLGAVNRPQVRNR